MSKRSSRRFMEITASWSPMKKSLFLVLVAIIVYGTVIALDEPVISKVFENGVMHSDIKLYRERTSTILEGGLLYTDVHTETPPLINYLLIPAQLLGGGDHVWVYSAYFALFGLLSALLMYHVLRRYDDRLAFLMGIMFILSPFGFIEAGLGEDETIVAFTVIAPALLMVLERNRLASLAIGLGIWTKMWAILLAPAHFLQQCSWKERWMVIGIIAGVNILVAAPFLILCGDEFTWFLQYYFIGNPERKAEGFSVFQFLQRGGFDVPTQISLAIVLIGLLFAYLYSYRKNLGKWESMTLVVTVFFILYPKMHTGYYLIPLAFLLAWAVENRRIAARCFLLFLPVIFATAFTPTVAPGGGGTAFIEFEGSWAIGLALSLASSIMLLETTYVAMKSKSFITRAIEKDSKHTITSGTAGPSNVEGPGVDGLL